MKKKITTIALSAFLFSAGMMAQTPDSNPSCGNCVAPDSVCNTEVPCPRRGDFDKQGPKCDKQGPKCDKQGPKCDRKGKCVKDFEKKGRLAAINPFAGIELTPEQQASVNKLKEDRRETMKKAREDMEKKTDKANEKFSSKLKKILTPEQYAQYEQNKEKMKDLKKGKAGKGDRFGKAGKHGKDGKAGKHGKDGKKGKNNCPAKDGGRGKVGKTYKAPHPMPMTGSQNQAR